MIKKILKKIGRNMPFYHRMRSWVVKGVQKRELRDWGENGKPVPPPHLIKQETLRYFAKKYGLKILVETGTYYGDMVYAMERYFESIYSIELSKEFHARAVNRFKGHDNIRLINGDSGIELGTIVKSITEPALFWLDGHYSGGETALGCKTTPIFEELEHIFSSQVRGHVIIIDDARCFGGGEGYPSLKELEQFVKERKTDVEISIADDSIRIAPVLDGTDLSGM